MTAHSLEPEIALIGETAGAVWNALTENGSMSINKLVKEVDQSRDVVMQALGWLAREDKITLAGSARARTIALK